MNWWYKKLCELKHIYVTTIKLSKSYESLVSQKQQYESRDTELPFQLLNEYHNIDLIIFHMLFIGI